MPLSASITERVEEMLSKHLSTSVDVQHGRSVGGGSINDAYRIDTNKGPWFVKVNRADRFPSMFEAEDDGLRRLRATGTIRVPEVVGHGEDHDDSFLLLEHIGAGTRTPEFWERFGTCMANLHRNTRTRFGLERDNYIGSLKQVNTPETEWTTFLIHCRLEPMLKMARDAKRVEAGMAFRFERLFGRLNDLFPKEPPALLHGDLWSGNFLTGPDGEPVLIDPSVYYGHREMDLAMTKLFGGFDPGFHTSYNAAWPMEKGWEDRAGLCNLYPLLVHVNLFGGGYVQQVERVLHLHT